MKALHDGTIDAVFDEGLILWFDEALRWRRAGIPKGRYPHLKEDHEYLDYSGWLLYTRASLPDDDAHKVIDVINARKDKIFREDAFTGIGRLGQDTPGTPLDVPLHPGAEKCYREHAFKV
jgi:TRAP-type uncharacterized transport system substrate-binding protein